MRIHIGVFAIISTAAFMLSHAPLAARQAAAGASTPKTTWDGIYSEKQAAAGEMIYDKKCARCHGPEGVGADGPALRENDFAVDFDDTPLYELFANTKNKMPQDDPGSLSAEQAASVVAYTLKFNGFPAGDGDLSADPDVLKTIKYLAMKP